MCTSGDIEAGSSSVPARTNRTWRRVYWLKRATWQTGHRQMRCFFPALRGTETGARALDSPIGPWVLRGALAVVFALAVVDLARDVSVLT